MFGHILNGVLYLKTLFVNGASAGGVLTVNTTQSATGANTDETDLWTYSLPANTLNADGKGVRVTAWGTVAANGNTKTIKGYFGSTAVVSFASTASGSAWRMVYEVARLSAGNQRSTGFRTISSGADTYAVSLTADETAAITIKVTGQNGSANANDIVFRGAIVELLN